MSSELSENFDVQDESSFIKKLKSRVGKQRYWLHGLLFVVTFLTTTVGGSFWVGKPIDIFNIVSLIEYFEYGLPYSIAFLTMLTFHEFGHFFAGLYHSIKMTLPFYIPAPPIPPLLNIGTFGAIIRIKEKISNSISLFDIGVYGPLPGFIVSLILLISGFVTLPSIEYVYEIHPEFRLFGFIPELPNSLAIGKNLIFVILEFLLGSKDVPPATEVYHYPLLFAGWLGCFVTALNLLPVGQLDGGHIIYAMFGRRVQRFVAVIFVLIIFILGFLAILEGLLQLSLALIGLESTSALMPAWLHKLTSPSWLLWGIILIWFVKIQHPPVIEEHPLDPRRMKIGWLSIVIFILCFTPAPFYYT